MQYNRHKTNSHKVFKNHLCPDSVQKIPPYFVCLYREEIRKNMKFYILQKKIKKKLFSYIKGGLLLCEVK